MKNNKKNNNITELVFILDRSGSMSGLESDTIGGFNAMLEKQKQQDGRCFVTTVLFDGKYTRLHDRVPLERVRPLTPEDYVVGGCTALLDALGDTIRHTAAIHRYARPEDVPAHTLFVITTDGMENASHHYTADEVCARIKHEQEKYGWEFLFVAANIDAVQTASRMGIRADRAVNYRHDSQGTAVLYETVGEAVCQMRSSVPLAASWSDRIREDNENRQ